MRQTVLIFSAIAVSLLILLNLRKVSLLSVDENAEIMTVVFAVIFMATGVVLSRYLFVRKKEDSVPVDFDPEEQLRKLGITQREYDVLKLVAEGHSNLEISKTLFISESTVKTHVSNVLVKLDAKRRTQAVQRAKELGIL
jgi:DNA-binding NarL/FixJ family response regulator